MRLSKHERGLRNVLLAFIFGCVLFFVSPLTVGAQESNSSAQPNTNALTDASAQVMDASVESVDREINVEQPIQDQEITHRILGILQSAGQYESLSVQSKEGLVFLKGRVDDEAFITFAGQVAKNTEGVVAVINRIALVQPSAWAWEPIQASVTDMVVSGLRVLPMVLIGLVVLVLCFLIARPLTQLLMRPFVTNTGSQLVQVVTRRALTLLIILFGFYFFLRIAGLTQVAVAIISGTGVIGLIVGFAFKDIAENFMASLLLSVQRPFQMGDVIEITGFKGVVQKVTARATTLVDFDGNHIQIPNATVYSNVIRNLTANPLLRGNFLIGIGYDASIRKAQKLAMKVLQSKSAVVQDPEPQVLVEELGSSTINLRIYYWIDHNQHSVSKVGSVLMRLIMRELEKNGISMPDDSREVIFPQGVPVIMQDERETPTALAQEHAALPTQARDTLDEDLAGADQDDISTDTDEIREQAQAARDPEAGKNIL
jgi:small conductance mechanosensitive channel